MKILLFFGWGIGDMLFGERILNETVVRLSSQNILIGNTLCEYQVGVGFASVTDIRQVLNRMWHQTDTDSL